MIIMHCFTRASSTTGTMGVLLLWSKNFSTTKQMKMQILGSFQVHVIPRNLTRAVDGWLQIVPTIVGLRFTTRQCGHSSVSVGYITRLDNKHVGISWPAAGSATQRNLNFGMHAIPRQRRHTDYQVL